MKNIVLIDRSKPVYKGNLHLHTTWSDGRLPAAKVVEAFKAKGYHFICLSDHEIYTRTDEFNSADFITIPGMERGSLNKVPDKDPGYHLGALDDPTEETKLERYEHLQQFPVPIPWKGDHSPQDMIDELRAQATSLFSTIRNGI
ncbi:hypothetical protein A8990_11989 [Paenibacillus taihuensis]|uniref:Polymerase/histidinol phosphatase N-terminal domain-containing protein n=1 Tax=Paenibacillus taihuensis TaxID=1156355 RepID=A0A3D9RUN2_9BACL|nr:hypothetical protein [Paenibacillus taihuensis]REE81254.1 hypothetical protein A8990_11989 [Paenibacillus taihuensis]